VQHASTLAGIVALGEVANEVEANRPVDNGDDGRVPTRADDEVALEFADLGATTGRKPIRLSVPSALLFCKIAMSGWTSSRLASKVSPHHGRF
jgi:hypothetical protein